MRSTRTPVDGREWRDVVVAAQNGDRLSRDALVEGWLPLVYNVVGRALNGHTDVDDVVQETMVRAVYRLEGLRDPDSFRSWLVAIAMRQVREWARTRDHVRRAEVDDTAAAADFADLTVLRLQLEGQRREVTEAVRWLDSEDRQLLSLWWLETAGELTRRELAAAAGITRQHAAVRVQRLKGRLETARGIVRALGSGCPELAREESARQGRVDSVWRKRIARHVRGCARCGTPDEEHVPVERLLAGMALVPVPVALTLSILSGGGKTAAAAAPASWAAKSIAVLTKPAVAATAGVTLVAGGLYMAASSTGRPQPSGGRAAPAVSAPVPTAAFPDASPATPSRADASPSSSPTATPAAPHAAYGTVVDTADSAPAAGAPPAALPRRAETRVVLSGAPAAGLTHRGESVTLTGVGYVRVRWQVLPSQRAGALVMPTWTGLTGRLFHVASGGGHRMDDRRPGVADGTTWMEDPVNGATVLPGGAQQMWQNEYFWINGSVTLHQNEKGADYNLFVEASSWTAVTEDVGTAPGDGVVRYGLVRDTGTDRAPVPQYLTRESPDAPEAVPQRSRPGPP
ncbi:sigma-70 family RNA polymerase sigma factor [Streptomyces daghestanicus]|uniref:sigma-70 family RNA polymerase sigma factor n=1 Tax=Streptomyces daghestanicus TaxID=66885 RepID=UPI00167EBF0C|nr:sigma-70 family RNA polymerase sigma factor [Streptomyces daghestanicus]